jgi:hypothetical protein
VQQQEQQQQLLPVQGAAAVEPQGEGEGGEQEGDDLPPLLMSVVVDDSDWGQQQQQQQQQEGQGAAAGNGLAGVESNGLSDAAGIATAGVGDADGGSLGEGGGNEGVVDMDTQLLPSAEAGLDVPGLGQESSASSEDEPGHSVAIAELTTELMSDDGYTDGEDGPGPFGFGDVVQGAPVSVFGFPNQVGFQPALFYEEQQQQDRGRVLQAVKLKRRAGLEAVAARAGEVGVNVRLLPVVAWEHWYHEMLE